MIVSALFWTFIISMFFEIKEKYLFGVFIGVLVFLSLTSDNGTKSESKKDNKPAIEMSVDIDKESSDKVSKSKRKMKNNQGSANEKIDKWAPETNEDWYRKSD